MPAQVQSYGPTKKTIPGLGKGGGGGGKGGGGRPKQEDFPGLPGATSVSSQPAVQSYRPVQKPKAEPVKQAKKLGGKDDFPGLPTPSRTGNILGSYKILVFTKYNSLDISKKY